MSDFLEIYVSGFWPWLGITIGMGIVLKLLVTLIIGAAAALRGTPIHIGDVNHECDCKTEEPR